MLLQGRRAALRDTGLRGDITGGLGVVDTDNESFKYGEYTGLSDDGLFFVGGADLSYSRDLYFLEFRALDLGLDSREVFIESGRLGRYRAFIGYSDTTHLISNNSMTPLLGAGGNVLTLPAGVQGADTTAIVATPSYKLNDVDLELERRKLALGFSEDLASGLNFSIEYELEKKDGIKSLGGTFGTNGGTNRAIVLPEPVDYTTNEIRASMSYSGEKANARFEYLLSYFNNDADSVFWSGPFTGFPSAGRISLPPDNIHQRFSLSGGVSVPYWSTRVNASAEYGMMEQDAELLPYSVNTASVVAVPVPRKSAQAEIDVTSFTLNIASRPSQRLGLNAKYRYYSADNRTPRDLFLYVKNDTAGAQAALNQAHALYSLPYGYTVNQLKLDASCRLFTATTVKAGYDIERMERDYREVKETEENTVRAAFQTQYIPDMSIGINASYSRKTNRDDYNQSNVYESSHTQDYINTQTLQFDNNPFMRKFDIAERDRMKAGASVSYSPAGKITISAGYDLINDDYEKSVLGIRARDTGRYTIDAAWAPVDAASIYAFYTRENIDTEQASRQFAAATKAQSVADDSLTWTAVHDEDIDTAGLGASIGFFEDRLTVNTDYAFSEGTTRTDFTSAFSAPQSMPELLTRLHVFSLTGKYRVNRNLSVGAGYRYENFESADWQTDNVDPGSADIAHVLTLSGPVEDYEAHQAMVFLTYRFGAEDI